MTSPAFISYPNEESISPGMSPDSPTSLESAGAPQSRIPIRSNSLPSLTHRLRGSFSIHSPRKNIATGDAPPLEHPSVSKYSHSKSLSDFIPHLPKMTRTLGSGLFPSRSRIPQRRSHTGSVFYEDDGMAESDSEEERSDQTYLPSCYPVSTISAKELDVHIPETSLWEEIQFPDFDDEGSRVHALSFIPDAKLRGDTSERREAKPQVMVPAATVEDELEWADLETEDVNLMRELLLGNLKI